eukprot:TRINITY_DN28950_c0_g1_i1.p1 TRINITY_DN28950_c0_g1~~TRINITY_DN28950_c0_g1_i1.p1  ORF type:complete len:244 (+),score=19.13 TRINITY_DN28950_c0_g1_i1:29-733(+)
MAGSKCQRIVLLACGSFNPPTILHLRLFELARDYFRREKPHLKVVGGIISPTHDTYQKKSLINSKHRLAMSFGAILNSDWIKVSDWEVRQKEWTRTRLAMDNYSRLVNTEPNLEWLPSPGKQEEGPLVMKLLCGADLLGSFSVSGLWQEEDILRIVEEYGIVVITREGSNPQQYIKDSPLLSPHAHNIHIVTEKISNEVSSTKIRDAVRQGDSIKYLVPDPVIEYIQKNNLYRE